MGILNEKERMLLYVIHESRLIGSDFLEEYKKEIKSQFSPNEMRIFIKKFLDNGLIEELAMDGNNKTFFLTKKGVMELKG